MQKGKRSHSEPETPIFSGYLFCSINPRRRKRYAACGDFFIKVTDALILQRLLFRKRSRCSLVNALATLTIAINLFRGHEGSIPSAEHAKYLFCQCLPSISLSMKRESLPDSVFCFVFHSHL